MIHQTERLILRPWQESDAEDLYLYAKDPQVGPIAGWNAHKNVEESLETIRTIFSMPEMYAICLKTDNRAIGSIGFLVGKDSNLEGLSNNEAEIGYWIGVPFWGQGLMTEAVRCLMKYAFETLHFEKLWCGYFEGNNKSKRVQQKCGFQYKYTHTNKFWEPMNCNRTEVVTCFTKEQWVFAAEFAACKNCELENNIAHLSAEKRRELYHPCAVNCVNAYVLKEMRRQFEECGRDLDVQYTKYGNTPYFFARIIEPGHVYEIGYPRCLCPMVESGFSKLAIHCECSLESIIYVYNDLLPDREIKVEMMHTVLTGASDCCFRVTVK